MVGPDEERFDWIMRRGPYRTEAGRAAAPQWLREEMSRKLSEVGAQLVSEDSADDAGGRLPPVQRKLPPYSHARRVAYGLMWGLWVVMMAGGGIYCLMAGATALGVVGVVLAVPAAYQAWRVWAGRVRAATFIV